jgi:NTE family protein
MKALHNKKIGLALGGGAARGGAHLGAIRALEEAGIRVDYVAGTSIGALVGAAFTTGVIDELESFTKSLEWKKMTSFMDVALPFSGVIDGRKVSLFLEDLVGTQSFMGLSPSLSVVACNLNGGREVVLREGNLVEAIRASISIPGIFRPVIKEGDILVDGGLVNPVPVSAVREMGADIVVAVDLNHKTASLDEPTVSLSPGDRPQNGSTATRETKNNANPLMRKLEALEASGLSRIRSWREKEVGPNLAEVLMRSLDVMGDQVREARFQENPPDLLIQPKVEHVSFLEFHRAKELIDVGYLETRSALARWQGSNQ